MDLEVNDVVVVVNDGSGRSLSVYLDPSRRGNEASMTTLPRPLAKTENY